MFVSPILICVCMHLMHTQAKKQDMLVASGKFRVAFKKKVARLDSNFPYSLKGGNGSDKNDWVLKE